VDVSSHAAFARAGTFDTSMALDLDDLDPFARVLADTVREFRVEFDHGYLLESPTKLRMLHGYFAALLGLQPFLPVRCNAPRFSAVIEPDGSLKPCFFLPSSGMCADTPIGSALNTPAGIKLRREQRRGKRRECSRCVCPAYKGAWKLLEGV
jgi:Fe-coproporphyrin III synthase